MIDWENTENPYNRDTALYKIAKKRYKKFTIEQVLEYFLKKNITRAVYIVLLLLEDRGVKKEDIRKNYSTYLI